MQDRLKRVLWLLNHKTLMPYEVPLLQRLGFEVFTPKVIDTPNFRSASVDFSYDESLTLPQWVLEKLNAFNFYEGVWNAEITTLVNRYFGTAVIIPHAKQVPQALEKFEGQILFRAFGLDNSVTYAKVLRLLYGEDILAKIFRLGDRFWFAQGYEQLVECEPALISRHAIFLPLGVPDVFWETENSYTGVDKRILFVCPNIVTNPYYAAIYKQFKREFGDLPHVIIGAQDKPVDDPHMLGFVTHDELTRLYRDCAVLYYHSTELRHVHYSPVEAAINGMPVVYYADCLLGRMTPEVTHGRCATHAQARATVERILAGDAEFRDDCRADQRTISYKFSDSYCSAEWLANLESSGFMAALQASRGRPLLREVKRTILRPLARGRARLHGLGHIPAPSVSELAGEPTPPDLTHRLEDGIVFSHLATPSFVKSIEGLAECEDWGRWSTGREVTIRFRKALPRQFKLIVDACAFGPNINRPMTLNVGGVDHEITIDVGPGAVHESVFTCTARRWEKAIRFTVPEPTVPENDIRHVGLGLVRLRIEPMVR